MTQDNMSERLVQCVIKHCGDGYTFDEQLAVWAASEIRLKYAHSKESFGIATDVQKLEQLTRSLADAQRIISELSAGTRSELNYTAPLIAQERRGSLLTRDSITAEGGLLARRTSGISSLMDAIAKVQRQRRLAKRTLTTGLANYEAVIVTSVCLKLWRESHEGAKVPKELHSTRPHPLGSFIEEVFHVMRINGTPRAALRALHKLGGEEQISLSIKVG
jgi:hypothetical protein